MNRIILPLVFMLLSFSAEARRYKIVGYVSGETSLKEDKNLATKFTHIHYTFLTIKNGTVNLSAQDSVNLNTLTALKKYNKKLKVLISVGGPQGSEEYSSVVKTEEGREKLANSILSYITKLHLDGIELYWVMSAGGKFENFFNPNDQKNYTLLMELLRKKLDDQSAKENRSKNNKYLLSLSGSGKRQYLVNSGLNKAHVFLDYISMQTFDYEATIVNMDGVVKNYFITSHYSNLYTCRQDNTFKFCVDNNINECLDMQIPSRKIVMGIPFYGKGWSNTYDEENGLFQKADASIGEYIPYAEIQKQYLSSVQYTLYWDKYALANYLFNSETGVFITYESLKSIRKKSNYIRCRKLGGAACVEYGMDNGELLKKVNKGLRGPAISLFRKKSYKPRNPNINKREYRRRLKDYNNDAE